MLVDGNVGGAGQRSGGISGLHERCVADTQTDYTVVIMNYTSGSSLSCVDKEIVVAGSCSRILPGVPVNFNDNPGLFREQRIRLAEGRD